MQPGKQTEPSELARTDLVRPSEEAIGIGSFWQAIGCRAVGAAIVTTFHEGNPYGFLALSATHLTADPPTILVSIDQRTSACAQVLASRRFAVNYLEQAQAALYARFTVKDEAARLERFSGVEWEAGVTGAPLLRGVVGALDCRLEESIERHGTIIAIGRLVDFRNFGKRQPLVHFQGKIG